MKTAYAVLALCVTFSLLIHPACSEELTYKDLVGRLTDLEYLATLPTAGNTCAQWSSWDRASQYDAANDKYIKWDANGDGNGIIRREGEQIVMAEMEGPGCIWRIWSAMPQNGHVKIYLDGSAEPTVDLPFIGYFDHKNAPFTGLALVHMTARGQNCYVPIPYQKSCKIVADKGWGNYYHFNYETFPKGTKVGTFSRNLSAQDAAALEAADKKLADSGKDPAGLRAGIHAAQSTVTIAPGSSTTVAEIIGPRAITAIRAKVTLAASADDRTVLRELAVRITWDGEEQPAVWAPLGDFFGTAAGANRYRSLPTGLTEDDWFYSYWYMPFAKSAKLDIINDGTQPRQIQLEVVDAPLTRPIEQLGRFHAKWHRDAFLPQRADRQIDWPMLITEGRGRFVGVMLHVWNPKGGWWGEGDEKFFVDGEKFPSTIGTGSEDYFGYAWGDPKLFQNAYHNQTISQNNKGHICVNRWHITDNVPFQKSFQADIEKYFPNTRPCLFAATTYWYLAAGGKDPYPAVPLSQRAGYWANGPDASKIQGAIEGEQMKILSKTAGNTQTQDLADHEGDWSDGKHLWWTGAKPGDKLELALPVAAAGKYNLTLQLTKASDYAIVQIDLDGVKLGQAVNLYSPNVRLAPKLTGDAIDLTAGQHKLTFEITGAAPEAKKGYMVGIDYVKLDPVKK